MYSLKMMTAAFSTLLLFVFSSIAFASLDLLAGVEAGIDTHTAMSHSDLAMTQNILSTQTVGEAHSWKNTQSGILYKIQILHRYSYGQYPCLAYQLSITQDTVTENKALDACQTQTGSWISISNSSSAL